MMNKVEYKKYKLFNGENMNRNFWLYLIVWAFLLSINFAQNVITVAQAGGGDYTTINEAVEAAVDGDIIKVFEGHYFETLEIAKAIIVKADTGIVEIINNDVSAYGILLSGGATLYGFTIQTNVEVENSSLIANSIIGRTVIPKSNSKIIGNDFSGSSSPVRASETTNNVQIISNVFNNAAFAIRFVSKVDYKNIIIQNNLFVQCSYAIDIGYSDSYLYQVKIINNTFYRTNTSLQIRNKLISKADFYCVISGNIFYTTSDPIENISGRGVSVLYNCSNYSDLGDTNIKEDALFINPTSDFHLQATSPCVDAGLLEIGYTDLDGTRNDMGAYSGSYSLDNYFGYSDPAIVLDLSLTPKSVIQGGTIKINAKVISK